MRSNRDLQLVTEYNEKFFDYKDFVDRLSDQFASRKISKADVNAEIQKYCRIHKGCNPDLILEDIEYNTYYKMDYQNDVLRAGINKMKSIRSSTMNNSTNNSGRLFGVLQSDHGHEYRWIFEEDSLIDQLNEWGIDYVPEDGNGDDIGFPIGGSNSSSTFFTVLNSDADVRKFLTEPGFTDSADPMLVDCAEFYVTVDTDDDYYGAVTSQYVQKLGLTPEELEQDDDAYGDCEIIEKIADYFASIGYDEFDYEDPFYGDNSDMRVSELIDLYHEVDPENTLNI